MAIFDRESNVSVLTNYTHNTENLCALSFHVKCRSCKTIQPYSNQSQSKQSKAQFNEQVDLVRLY